MSEIIMPKLSDSMEEGTILSWLRANGDAVEAGEDLVEIETDKATVVVPAETSGVLTIVAPEGETLPVGATIGQLGAASAAPEPSEAELPASSDDATTSDKEVTTAANASATGNGLGSAVRVGRATPVARRAAAKHGVALEEVEGSGPLGRITRTDVLRRAGIEDAPPRRAAPPTPAPPSPPPPQASTPSGPAPASAKGEVESIALSRLQTVVARRMAEAKATIPHFQVQTEVDMNEAVVARANLKGSGADVVPSFNDFIVKAAALALRAHQRANGAYRDGLFEQYSRVNVGIAVAADDALVVPTIFDADRKGLGAIAADARRLAGSVRDGSVTPAELSGATFTVSNLGMYGMTAITPVINAPQAAILGVGAMREVLARVDGEIVDRHLLTLTLSCDHRILYGAQAAEFLSMIRSMLEKPVRLAL